MSKEDILKGSTLRSISDSTVKESLSKLVQDNRKILIERSKLGYDGVFIDIYNIDSCTCYRKAIGKGVDYNEIRFEYRDIPIGGCKIKMIW